MTHKPRLGARRPRRDSRPPAAAFKSPAITHAQQRVQSVLESRPDQPSGVNDEILRRPAAPV